MSTVVGPAPRGDSVMLGRWRKVPFVVLVVFSLPDSLVSRFSVRGRWRIFNSLKSRGTSSNAIEEPEFLQLQRAAL